jgi:NRAMP (natural resistance-associated macrophage protein)-like metal ion transporter
VDAEEAIVPAARGLRARRFVQQLLLFLAVMGPGLITANVDNDAGGITTYSLAGAQFGYKMLWTLLPITLALIVVQEMSARMGVVTGKGLADLIRENFGVKVTFWVMVALLIADLGNTIAEFSGVAASLEIFNLPRWVSVPGAAVAVWLLVVRGTYRVVEKIFLVACTVYFTYIVSGFLARPNWSEVAWATVTPTFQFRADYVTMLIGVVGTTIAPWMQFYLQSAVVEKGVRVEEYQASRLDVVVGCIITDVVAFFIIVCCAVTLYKAGIHIETAKEAALALAPLAGKWCSLLFAFGLFNASIFAASILPLATAYYVCEGFGWESGIDRRYGEAKQFYWLYTAIIVVGAGFVLIPRLPLLRIMLFTQVVNGVLLPFILIFMLVLINKPRLMGRYRNGPWFNFAAWSTAVILIALTVYLVVQGAHDLIVGA